MQAQGAVASHVAALRLGGLLGGPRPTESVGPSAWASAGSGAGGSIRGLAISDIGRDTRGCMDSMDVYKQAKRLWHSGEARGRHVDPWRAAMPHLRKVTDVVWVKAPLTTEEAEQSVEDGGYPMHRHDLNIGAAALVARGAAGHTEDAGAQVPWEWEAWRLHQHTRYLPEVSQAVRLQGQRR